MKNNDFEELLASVKEAGAIRRGETEPSRRFVFKSADIKAIRGRLNLTQPDFAAMIGVSVGTLRNWEQGRRVPDGPAMALLQVASREPLAVLRALRG
ncbi:MAG TPA: NadS family protein [Myxococcota bacterium]|nr:NadS family protein [Myxococcota bacterium]